MKNLFKISLVSAIATSFASSNIAPFYFNNSASAQLIPDRSLGNESSVVNSANNLLQVDGGATRGNNLFHSFQEFNVNTNQELFFNNGNNIQSILTRVTGGNISNIDGLISNVGQADLFILNPAGIVFGEKARLNIGGSFFATTAESIFFADNSEFSVNDVNSKPLLTVSAPIGLGLNNPGKIINRANLIKEERFGDDRTPLIFPNFDRTIAFENKIVNTLVGLEVNQNHNITLVGGDIELDGGGLTALGGKIQLGGLATKGIIKIEANGNLLFPNNRLLSNISLINDASMDVQGNSGGDIIITGQNIVVKDGSSLLAGIRAFKGSPNARAGDIIINGIDSVVFDGVRNNNSPRGGAKIFTTASNQVGLLLEKEFKTESGEFDFFINGKGDAGNILINTNKLNITNGARIINITFGQGNAGDIIINAEEKVILNTSGSAIFNTIFVGKGDAGNILINTRFLSLTDGAIISENNFQGKGDLGKIIINAEEKIFIDGKSSNTQLPLPESAVFNIINDDGVGNGNTIEIHTNNLSLTNEGQLFTSTLGTGNAGNVTINAKNNVSINNGNILSEVGVNEITGNKGKGNGGTINIDTDRLTISNQGSLSVSSNADGKVGQILIKANLLEIKDRGFIQAETNFENSDNLVQNNTKNNIGIDINGNLTLQNNSQISAKATGQANGGNVAINADFILAFPENNDIIASAEAGKGGNISITTNGIFGIEFRNQLTSFSDITVSSKFGLDGDVSIDILEVNPGESLAQLTTEIIDGSKLIAKSCLPSSAEEEINQFVVTGRGGLPTNPNDSLRGNALLSAEWLTLPQETKEAKIIDNSNLGNANPTKKIVEAQGWIVGANGNVILTTNGIPEANGYIPWLIPDSCQ